MKFRGLAGVVLAAATLLALAPGASAMAESASGEETVPVSISTDDSASIKVMGTETALTGHRFKAVRLGTYVDATASPGSGGKLVAVSVGTDSAAKGPVTDVLGKMGEPLDDKDFKGNPVGQVASEWVGYPTGDDGNKDTVSSDVNNAWGGSNGGRSNTGKLRDFAQTLDADGGFRALVDAASVQSGGVAPDADASSAGGYSIMISHLRPGFYVVIDVTSTAATGGRRSGGTNSIPMMVGTAVGSYDELGGAPLRLGLVRMKNTDATISAKWTNSRHTTDIAVRDDISYTLSSTVPLTTGFSHYRYVMTADMSQGQTYPADYAAPVVRIGARRVPPVSASNPNGAYVYSQTTAPDGGVRLVFDFSDRIMNYQSAASISITYKMHVGAPADPSAHVRAALNLQYSNDPHCQPQMGCNGADGTVGSLDDDNSIDIPLVGARFMTSVRTEDGVVPSVAGFSVTRDSDGRRISFTRLSDGAYQAADDDSPHQVGTVVSASGGDARSGGSAKGELAISGLAFGTYTVRQVSGSGRGGLAGRVMPSFKVTISPKRLPGGFTDANNVSYTNTSDSWHTVPANSFSKGVLPVVNDSSVTQLPLDGEAGWLALGMAVVLAILTLLVLGLMKWHDRESRM